MLTRRRFFGLLAALLLGRPTDHQDIPVTLGPVRLEAIRVQGARVPGFPQRGMLSEPTLYLRAGEARPEWVTTARKDSGIDPEHVRRMLRATREG